MRIFKRLFLSGHKAGELATGEGLQVALYAGWLPEALLKPLVGGEEAPVQRVAEASAVPDTQSSDWLSRFYVNQSC